MTKSEFLEKLKSALGNDLSGSIIQENINYYSQYISDEINKGRSEQEVTSELGDPWVLAQTIIATAENQRQAAGSRMERSYQQGSYGSQGNYQPETTRQGPAYFFQKWGRLILIMLGVIGIFAIIVTVVGGILSFLAPVLVPLIVIVLIVRMFKKR